MSDKDLSQFEAADTAMLELMNQKEEPLLYNGQPVVFEMYGPGSTQYAKAQAEIDSASQTRAFAAIRGKVTKDAAEESRKLTAKKLAACTKSVGVFPADALTVYSNPKLGYITNQVSRFIEDWGNFPAGSVNS
jgi:TnpA family transposase